ncbi:Glutathione S-transferase Mu 3 [Larimichthys crocea]|uniref:Uncharacterized protein n=1 Tax=Larimichthys crocea TaxID=215358 RepID=A0ACD3R9W0_LARCR|nr:Glutathione S-transferase Mu 3 [Larimichthys crocea]
MCEELNLITQAIRTDELETIEEEGSLCMGAVQGQNLPSLPACCWSTPAPVMRTSFTSVAKLQTMTRAVGLMRNTNLEWTFRICLTLEDGDRKIVQSNAIMRYIARKHNMCGETEDEKVRVDIMENQAMDFRNGFVRLCYTDFITFVDFIMYELLDQHRMFHPTCLDDFKNLKDLLDRFEALEKISAYMKSDRFMKTPVNNKMAKWGNKKE